ncbi:MAG: integrase [Spartobacteria bacterium]|nr:integrase [Spartobacteria bacterium]
MAARQLHRLSAREVTTLATVGRHADGGNLYLSISPTARRWVFLYRARGTGRLREMGLGPAPGPKKPGLSLQDARGKAAEARRLLLHGTDPITDKRSKSGSKTFGEFADELLDDISSGFRNLKHRTQWETTLKTHAASLRPKLLKDIGTDDVLEVLRPIWEIRHETASRVRGRIERVLDAARAKGLRIGENPARWRGHLKELLSKRKTLTRGHHGALPYAEMPAFMSDLHVRKSVSALALEFTILTAVRTSEAIGANWAEVDLDKCVWTIPANRIKAGKEHRVPLTARAIEILRSLSPQPEGVVFPGQKRGMPLSNMAMLELLRSMRGRGLTTHGFRSSFKDWAAETTTHENIVTEMALAHAIGTKVESAYRRGDLFQKRQSLMDDWAHYLSGEIGNVVSIKRSAK